MLPLDRMGRSVLLTVVLRWLRRAAGALAFLLAAALPATPIAAENLLTNGSFELGPAPGESMPVPMGSSSIPGWVVVGAPVDYVGTLWNAAEGTRSMALNGTTPGGISQSIPTVSGEIYTVRFFMAGDAFSDPILKHMRVSAAGQSQDYEFDAGHSWPWGMGWLEKNFAFTANAASTALTFTSLDAGETGPTLDSVVVTGPDLVGVGDPAGPVLALAPPHPNPSRNGFAVSFEVPAATPIRLSVVNVAGREIHVLAEGVQTVGRHTLTWNGRTRHGDAAPGFYLIRLETPGGTLVQKAVLFR